MSFRLFIYYCALCGGWAAFLTWVLVRLLGISRISSEYLQALATGAVLGMLVAGAVGLIDAVLNATGTERLSRTGLSAGLGLLGGALGGLVGQVLYSASSVGLLLILGWMLAGVLIGASIGAYDILLAIRSGDDWRGSMKKLFNGVLGGLLGGLIGSVPYALLQDSTSLPNSGSTIGLVVLGSCIGLMIGLAQVMLKEAWLKIEEGFRAGRELPLTKDETTIGRAESCDLGLFGDNSIERLHARIVLDKKRYLLAVSEGAAISVNDEPVGNKPRPLRSGDRIRIGKSVLSFGERQKRK